MELDCVPVRYFCLQSSSQSVHMSQESPLQCLGEKMPLAPSAGATPALNVTIYHCGLAFENCRSKAVQGGISPGERAGCREHAAAARPSCFP